MDTNALRAFITIVDQGSFSEAAESLHLTQPAISKRLAALESQLDARLIDRSSRDIRLTDAGNRLLPHARRILDEIHNARVALAPDSEEVDGELSLLASHHIGLHHLPGWLRRFSRDYPRVALNVQFMESDAAYEQLPKRHTELTFVTLSDSMDTHLNVYVQWPDPMVFVAGREHPLAALGRPTLADLSRYPALLPATGTSTYRLVSRLFLEANLPLDPQMPTNYLETLKMMTTVGLGWSVLPQRMVDDGLVALDVGHTVTRVLGGIGLSGRDLSAPARALLALVREIEGA